MGAFVSYSHLDKDTVSNVIAEIRGCCDESLWYDESLRGGDRYFSIIAKEILKNDTFIFMVSKNSVTSDWCIQELQFAMSEKKKIISVWIEAEEKIVLPAEIKFIIHNKHYVHWFNNNEKFPHDMLRCFSSEEIVLESGRREDDEASITPNNEKYFVSEEKKNSIKKLLKLEGEDKYSICFKGDNAVLLGLAYELGIFTERDTLKASFYYQVGIYKQNVDAVFLYSSLMLQEDPDNSEKYISDMKNAAEQGSVYAMIYYGDMCFDGKYNVEKNRDTAVSLWKKAADMEAAEAQYYMSYCYRFGESVEQNYCLALMFALNSAEHKFPRAFRTLGRMYEFGEFVQLNLDLAKDYYKEAIKLGDRLSLSYLGGIYYYDEKDYERSIEFYKKAVEYADDGVIKSGRPYYEYGCSLEYGRGIEQNLEEAIDYYFKAVFRGYESAKKYIVGSISDLTDEVKKIELLKKAAEYDCRFAESDLGDYYLDKGMTDEAIAYFKQGSEKGCLWCIRDLIRIYSLVFGDKKYESYFNRDIALKYYQMFFSIPHEEENMDDIPYYYGYGIELAYDPVSPDIPLAIHYFNKCIEADTKEYITQILHFAIEGFLFPEESNSGLGLNVEYCEMIISSAEKYFDIYVSGDDYDKDTVIRVCDSYIKAYRRISELKKGRGIRNKAFTDEYSLKVKKFCDLKNKI